jgi:hypothetical protein
MKKITLFFFLLVTFSFSTIAQTIVSTTPENKKALLEEFTGTGCPNCPDGHATAASILAADPLNVFVIAYHPDNSSYTTSDPMATNYPAAFYNSTFVGSRFMPGAIINRRIWGAERMVSRTSWQADVNTIKAEASPLNVGVSSSYNTTTSQLSIDVEVYFTQTVTDAMTIYCMLTEDGIIAAQSNGTSPYTHNHVFREAFVAQWGDAITTPTTAGTLKTFTFNFDNSTTAYDMTKSEVVAFVRNAADEEIISVNGAEVDHSTPVSVMENEDNNLVGIYPNPTSDVSKLYLTLDKENSVSYTVYNAIGQVVIDQDMGTLNSGQHSFPLDLENQSGLFFVKIIIGEKTYTNKLIVQ